MYLALRTIMQENNIPEYEVTETDQLVLANWHCNNPDLDTPEGQICNLAKRIYHFDYFYSYSDCGTIWRRWSKEEDEITEQLRLMPDRVMAEYLGKHRNADMARQLVTSFPFLNQSNYSLYARLIHSGFTPEQLTTLLGVKEWIDKLGHKVYVEGYEDYVLYATDIAGATKYLRQGEVFDALHSKELKPLSVPSSYLKELKVLGDILELRGVYTVLKENFGSHQYHIQYVPGFTVYYVQGFFIMI